MIKFEDLDDAVIGPARIWGPDGSLNDVLVYDGEKIREILMARDDMSAEDALEYIEFNMEGGYLGPNTPVIAWPKDEWVA
jgi:hypothetical protein